MLLFIYGIERGFTGQRHKLKSTSNKHSPNLSNGSASDSIKDVILNKIENLPEVKRANHFIDSFSNHKHGISFRITDSPDLAKNFYSVQAGYNGEFRYENYFTFYVDPQDLTVKYYDVLSDSLISLAEWRHLQFVGKCGPVF